jgi:hypothetical protein
MATQYTAGIVQGQKWTAAIANQIGAAWETWTPTVSAQSGTITSYTVSARYAQVQKLVFIKFSVSIANKGTAAGAMNLTIPITAHSTYGVNNPAGAIGSFSEWTAVGFTGTVNLLNSTTVLALLKYDWTTPFVNGTISGFGVYEAA